MFPLFWIWSPQLHYPWSGSVAQQIEPNTNWFFDAISPDSGVAAIEKKAIERASYGRPLGLINEVLLLPDVKNRLLELGTLARGNSQADMAQQFGSDIAKWAAVIKAAGIAQQ